MPLTFNGRNIITFPPSPATNHIEFTNTAIVSASTSPFSGQQQTQTWNASGWSTIDLTFPPMRLSDAATFTQFYVACAGISSVFQLPSWLQTLVPTGFGVSGYWSLASNTNKFSIDVGLISGFAFVIREVISNA